MSLQLHKPNARGGLEPRTASVGNWRRQLRSPRGGDALPGNRLPDQKNTEMEPTSRARSLLFWAVLASATFVLLVIGYSTRFWGG